MPRRLSALKELVRPYYLRWLYFPLKQENRPAAFRTCWDFPALPIETFHEDLEAQRPDLDDVIFLPMADWHTCMQRSQHLANAFAATGHRCFYVNPHLGREFPQPYPASPRVLVSTLAPQIRELHVHLRREPVFHHRCLRSDENAAVFDAIDAVLRKASSRSATVIVSLPLWNEVAARLRERWGCRIVYDCHDLLEGFGNVSADLLQAERELFDASDLVTFSAQWLLDWHVGKMPDLWNRSVIIRNGSTIRDFHSAFEERIERRSGDSQKTVGYVGSIESWFDEALVSHAARLRPDWRFVLIGHVGAGNYDALKALPNVSLPGYVPYQDLPMYLSQMDVGIIPFVRNSLTLATNPVKLYEYFACGLPVVSTRLPELEPFAGLVNFADTPEEFLAQIEHAMLSDTPKLQFLRRQAVENESWSARCRELMEAMRTLASRPAAPMSDAQPETSRDAFASQ